MDISAIDSNWFYACGGFLIGALVSAVVFLMLLIKTAKQNAALQTQVAQNETLVDAMELRFKDSATQALQQNNEHFLNLAQEKLKQSQNDSKHDLDKRQQAIGAIIEPIQKHLKDLNGALEQVKGTDQELRNDLKNLSQETAKLVGALRDPAGQGRWGEYILERLLEKSGLIKGVHYETQVSLKNKGESTGGSLQRPDVVINLQDGFHIIVDAKAPINEQAARLSENISEDEYETVIQNLAKQVKSHVNDLSGKKYWENIDSPDFTVLFLPSEYLFSTALRADPDLADYAMDKNVIIASPTLLMSLMRVVGMSWRQVELADNAKNISNLGKELYERISTFCGYMESVGKSITSAGNNYNKAISSLESRVLVSARKFEDLQAAPHGKSLPASEPLDQTLRSLNAPEVNTSEEKEEPQKKSA